MSTNQIPEKLKCDHLFLLIGGNPLPNWVAARLLLKEDGQLYLARSEDTIEIAQNLGEFLIKKGIRQPIYIEISDPSNADAIYNAIRPYLKNIRSGQIGLNYTGGTKAMSVHGYRAIEKEIQKGVPRPIFSYLDARTLEMRFDNGEFYFVGLAPELNLGLNEIMLLHGIEKKGRIKQEPIAESVTQALVNLHITESGFRKWKEWKDELKKCASNDDFKSVEETLLKKLQITEKVIWPFKKAGQLIHWIEGPWVESYVVSLLQKNKESIYVNDFGWGIETKGRLRFEGDVIAIRGYQCHFISCYSGENKKTCKWKLTEVFVRASQFAGDEARVALVCMFETPKDIENEVSNLFRAKGRIKVFGRRDLENLESLLVEWFNEQIPPEEAV